MTANYSWKKWYDHLWSVVNPPWRFLGSWFAVFATLWTLIEAGSFFGEQQVESFQNNAFYLYLAVFSCLIGFIIRFREYWKSAPSFAESLPISGQRLVRIQSKGWEFHLAQVLIAKSIRPLDQRLENVISGKAFIRTRLTPEAGEYMELCAVRSEDLLKASSIAQHIFTEGLPQCFAEKKSAEERVILIQEAIRDLRAFYLETIVFEEVHQSTCPPEGFENIHELQCNWSEPIRDSLRQVLMVMQSFREAVHSPDEEPSLTFSIEMNAPESIDEYCEELERMTNQLNS